MWGNKFQISDWPYDIQEDNYSWYGNQNVCCASFVRHFEQSSLSLTSLSEFSLLVSPSVSMSCSVPCTKETVLGLHVVDLRSHLQNSEQSIWADEQLHISEEHGFSLLQLLLINLIIYEGTTSTPLGSDTGQYAPDRPSDVQPNSSRSSSGGSCCNATFQIQASKWACALHSLNGFRSRRQLL